MRVEFLRSMLGDKYAQVAEWADRESRKRVSRTWAKIAKAAKPWGEFHA